tara:strand:- start:170 stop:433 length:264 start_codon:yes stop_codon:yes gene_type:complete
MFKNIEKTIEKLFSKDQKKDFVSFLEIKKIWKKTISKEIQKNAKIIDYSNKKITIKSKTPAWKNELIFLKKDIKKNSQPQTGKLKTL